MESKKSGAWYTRYKYGVYAEYLSSALARGAISLGIKYVTTDTGERNKLAMSSADDSYLWLWILPISMAHERRACLVSQRREQTT